MCNLYSFIKPWDAARKPARVARDRDGVLGLVAINTEQNAAKPWR
jgi:hypothetical protein